MNSKYKINYVGPHEESKYTIIFAGSTDEAVRTFQNNYNKRVVNGVQKLGDIIRCVNGVPFYTSNYEAKKIDKEVVSYLLYEGEHQTQFDWFIRQESSPGCKFHIFFLTKKPPKIAKDFFTNSIDKTYLRNLVEDYFEKDEKAVDEIYIYYTEVN